MVISTVPTGAITSAMNSKGASSAAATATPPPATSATPPATPPENSPASPIAGVSRAISIYAEELDNALALLGRPDFSDIDRSVLAEG